MKDNVEIAKQAGVVFEIGYLAEIAYCRDKYKRGLTQVLLNYGLVML